MSKNPLFRNGEENETVIRNPRADADRHQKLSPATVCLKKCPKFDWLLGLL